MGYKRLFMKDTIILDSIVFMFEVVLDVLVRRTALQSQCPRTEARRGMNETGNNS